MAECRGGDGLIKLFGKTIPVPEPVGALSKDLGHSGSSSTESGVQEITTDPSPQPEVVDAEDPAVDKGSQLQSGDDEAASEKEKLKKPDKILPCPRCSSMDTKFCYFNNYNINQPRHFCKKCQRYWTAGGAMRNVPVGAGRRKNKNVLAASNFLQRVRAALPVDTFCSSPCPPVKTNGTVLSFGHDASSTLDLAEHLKDNRIPIARSRNARDNPSMGSCSEVVSSNRNDKDQRNDITVEKSANGVQQQHPAGMNGGTMWPYGCTPSPAAYYTSGIAIPIYPGAPGPGYWGCMVPGAWSLPWPVQCQPQALSSPTSAPSVSSAPSPLTLGKHPRDQADEGNRGHGNGNGKVWVPKTIRIDNADEVARSSIRSLFGIKGDDRDEQISGTSGQKLATSVFEPKQHEAKMAKHAEAITSLPLLHHANPVALTRSVIFHEGS